VEVDAFAIVGLFAADGELVLDEFDRELIAGEAGNRQGDAQPVVAGPLDIVGRIALGVLGEPVERPLELIETQQQG
jgi:hypothetical protein